MIVFAFLRIVSFKFQFKFDSKGKREMEIKKIVVLGANGMLGQYIRKYFELYTSYNVIPIKRDIIDAENDTCEKIEKTFRQFGVNEDTVVFNAIGAIPHANVTDKTIYVKVNSEFPKKVSKVCILLNVKFVHPSTDCVYSGIKGSYVETDRHDTESVYGMSKSQGEDLNATIIRTSIIGENAKGISLVEWIKQNRNSEIGGYTNHFWNGITCLEYAKLLRHMFETNTFWKGVRHIHSPKYVSKNELCKMISDVYDLGVVVKDVLTEGHCDRTLQSLYEPFYSVKDLKDQILEMRDFSDKII